MLKALARLSHHKTLLLLNDAGDSTYLAVPVALVKTTAMDDCLLVKIVDREISKKLDLRDDSMVALIARYGDNDELAWQIPLSVNAFKVDLGYELTMPVHKTKSNYLGRMSINAQ